MSFCSHAEGAAMFDATPIENLFLMEYMCEAPGPELKVYLYARMLALHPELGGTLADMAKKLNMGEDDVYKAFVYWEQLGLVSRLTDQPPTYAFAPMRAPAPSAGTVLDREIYANRDFNNKLRRLFGDQFIGDHELRKAGDWQSVLHFDQAAIIRMVQYGIEQSTRKNPRPPSVFKRVDRLAESWSKKGVHTLEEVERAIAEECGESALAREVLKKLSLYRDPTPPELALVRRWTGEWGYSPEQVLEACDDTVNARNPTMKYLNSILDNRRTEVPGERDELVTVLKELNPKDAQPSPDQLVQYRRLKKHFSTEMIRLAAIQCRRANKNRIGDLIGRLDMWNDEGVNTPEAAEQWMQETTALSRELREKFRLAGYVDRSPQYPDIKIYRDWKSLYPDDLINFAAECSKNAGGSMSYMEKLLKQWHQDGITTVAQARVEHETWKQSAKANGEKPLNPALNYAQREYRDEDFGDDFFVDLDKYGEEDAT